jgi:hypothetical protein
MPPSSAHLHEPVPRTCGAHIIHYICPVEVEDDQEDIVGEDVDRHTACTTQFRQFHWLAVQKERTSTSLGKFLPAACKMLSSLVSLRETSSMEEMLHNSTD